MIVMFIAAGQRGKWSDEDGVVKGWRCIHEGGGCEDGVMNRGDRFVIGGEIKVTVI